MKDIKIKNINFTLSLSSNAKTGNVANQLGFDTKFLNYTLYQYKNNGGRNRYYRPINIPKSNGKTRRLHAVEGQLKTLQEKTYEYLSANYLPSKWAKGFVKEESIITNAKHHRNKKLIIKMDIKDFFPKIKFSRVMGMFQKYPFNFSKEDAIIFSQICCLDDGTNNYNGSIAQGAVTSPYISNMICIKMDKLIFQYAMDNKFHFTRYADDITLSTNKWVDVENTIESLESIIRSCNFSVNKDKTRVLKRGQRQAVTGIIVNEGLNVNRKYIRNIRALMHNCRIHGVLSQVTKNHYKDERNTCSNIEKVGDEYYLYGRKKTLSVKKAKEFFLLHIKGRIDFVGQVARGNEGFGNPYYEKRTEIHEKLMIELENLALKEKSDGFLSMTYRKILKDNINQELISKVSKLEKDKLDIEVQKLSNADPRFFVTTFKSSNLEEYRKTVTNLLKRPVSDINKVKELLSCLADSKETLGALVHEKQLSNKDIYQWIKNYETEYEIWLPEGIRNVFNEFIGGVKKFSNRNDKNEILDFSKEEKFNKVYSYKFKRATRFGRIDDNTSTNLEEFINKISKKCTKKIVKKLTRSSFYTDVESLRKAIESLLKSMDKNSDDEGINLSIAVSKEETIITINDLNTKEVDIDCNRNIFPRGKIREAIRHLNAIAEYSFIANFKNHSWQKINMMRGNDRKKCNPLKGVTHEIRIPNI